MSKHRNGTSWVTSQSGNPGDRPKMPEDLKGAIKVRREAMQSDDLRARIMVAAHAHLEALKARVQSRVGDEDAAVAVASASVEDDEAPTTH